jgi:hypothetical protein
MDDGHFEAKFHTYGIINYVASSSLAHSNIKCSVNMSGAYSLQKIRIETGLIATEKVEQYTKYLAKRKTKNSHEYRIFLNN